MPRHATTIFSEVRRINERRYSCAVQAYRLVLRTCSQKRATAEQSACGSLVQARSRSHLIISKQNTINWLKNLGFSTLNPFNITKMKKGDTLRKQYISLLFAVMPKCDSPFCNFVYFLYCSTISAMRWAASASFFTAAGRSSASTPSSAWSGSRVISPR